MDLSIASITLNDFKSFSGGPHMLSFDEHPLGLCYIKGINESDERLGSNGSGKSSIWDALVWCLYGKTIDDLRNPDIRPWFGGKTSTVDVDVVIDEKHYIITRQTNSNRLRIDGKDVGQEDIEDLIYLNFDTFLNTVLLGQGRPLFLDLEPRLKMKLFSDVLNLGRWEDRSKAASASVSDLERVLTRIEHEYDTISALIANLEKQLDKNTRLRDSWIEDNEQKIAHIENEVAPLEDQYTALSFKYIDFDVEEDMASTHLSLMLKDNKNNFDALFSIRDKISSLDAERKALNRALKELRQELNDLGEADVCPTCGQSVKGTDLDKHKKELRRKIRTHQNKINAIDNDAIYDEYEEQERRTNDHRDLCNTKEAELKKLKNDKEYWYQRCGDAKVKLRQLNSDIESLQEQSNPYTKQVRDAQKEIKELNSELSSLERKQKKLETKIRRTKYWVKGFKDIRLIVIEDVLQELEIVTESMLQDLGLSGWKIKYDIEKETASGTIKSGLNVSVFNPKYKKIVKWKSWSGGEAQRLRIIGSLALSEVLLNHSGVQTDMEILDEPIKNMGSEGVEDLCRLLYERSRSLDKQIWYIDHQTVENSLFDSVVTVVKDTDRRSSIRSIVNA